MLYNVLLVAPVVNGVVSQAYHTAIIIFEQCFLGRQFYFYSRLVVLQSFLATTLYTSTKMCDGRRKYLYFFFA